jgi:histidinol phosphatase-like enzyme
MDRQLLVICDRDGTLIHNNKSKRQGLCYITRPDEIEFIEGVLPALRDLKVVLNPCLGVITCQNCISKGIATVQDIRDTNAVMVEQIRKNTGFYWPAVRVMWGLPRDKISARVALITNIIYHFNYDQPANSWLIDDSVDGIKAAQQLGINAVHIQNPYRTSRELAPSKPQTFVVNNFKDAVTIIIREVVTKEILNGRK